MFGECQGTPNYYAKVCIIYHELETTKCVLNGIYNIPNKRPGDVLPLNDEVLFIPSLSVDCEDSNWCCWCNSILDATAIPSNTPTNTLHALISRICLTQFICDNSDLTIPTFKFSGMTVSGTRGPVCKGSS